MVVQGNLEAHLHANTLSVYLGVQSPSLILGGPA